MLTIACRSRETLNDFQPKFGLAYQIRSTTVLRAGYGLSCLPTFDTGFNQGFSRLTPFVASPDGGLRPANRLSNPFPNGLPLPVGRSLGTATLLGRDVEYGFYDRRIPKVHQFSAAFQQELPWRVLIDASYVGSASRGLQWRKGINEVPADKLSLGNALLDPVSNPFAGLLPGTQLNGATVPRQQLFRAFPQFLTINQDRTTIGYNDYHPFQLQIGKRLSAGFNFLASYTLSKSIEAVRYLNPQDRFEDLARELSSFDAPHRLVLSGIYNLPLFQGSPRLTRALLSGWQVNGIATFQSGLPVDAPGAANTPLLVSTGLDPKFSGEVRTRDRWFNTCTTALNGASQNCASPADPVAFTVQAPFTLRTLSYRFPTIRTSRPGIFDLSIFNAFASGESVKLQFRAESFNVFNTPWFGAPNTTAGSSAFGVVTPSQQNDRRNIQLALKVAF